MTKGITVPIASDSREFVTGVQKGVIKPLEDAEKAIDEVQKAGDQAGDKLERSFKDAQTATSQFKQEQSEAGRVMNETYSGSARQFEVSEGSKKRLARESIREIGDEAKANAAETFSSFNGSAQSFVDGVQGTLGGLVGSFGPIGLAVASAGALGIGAVNGLLTKSKEKLEAYKARVASIAKSWIDAGKANNTYTADVIENLKTMDTVTDGSVKSLADIRKEAEKTGVPFELLAQAYAGNEDALESVIRMQKLKIAADQEETTAATGTGREQARLSAARTKANRTEIAELNEQQKTLADAKQDVEDYYEAVGKGEEKAAVIQSLNEAFDDAAGSVDDYLRKETGLFDVEKYLKAMHAREKALNHYQETLATTSLSDAAKAYIESQGVASASSFLDGYEKATPKQQKALDRIWSEAGKSNSGEYSSALNKAFADKPVDPPKVGKLDLTDAERQLAEFAARKRTVDLTVTGHTRDGRSVVVK